MESVSQEQAKALATLMDDPKLDFWDFPRDLMVPPSEMKRVTSFLNVQRLKYSVWMEDVQEKIDGVFSDIPRTEEFDYFVYHTYDEIIAWIGDTVATNSDITSSESIGTSYEGRDLPVLKLGIDTGKVKKVIWFNGAIHAREWISPATVMAITNQLIVDYRAGDPDITFLLETYDFHILIMFNPDGYDYTWTNDRMWRKTRSPNDGSPCDGTDPNRNFDYEWGGLGASTLPCGSTYRGSHALSEIEVVNVEGYLTTLSATQELFMYIDWHSYSELMLSAWGYTDQYPVDYADMDAHMQVHTQAMGAVHGHYYEYGASGVTLYPTSGTTVDWAYGDRGIIYAYTIELRDTGEYGFLLPEDQIQPTAEENYAGLIAGLLFITP
uniref:Carboxypeptidase A4-like n=1 Tax=Saccoglossus kowalevskii TaxID=10224 RepID=A0ABM0LX83_SACKO|nr:PREDICTED: carboxypeptidase A4-like [Saccoglossus kowalevskii]